MKFYYLPLCCISFFLFSSFISTNKKEEKSNPKIDEINISSFKVDNSYLDRHDIVFLAPTLLEAEGFPMGNGDLGGMIWNHDNGIELQINKNDLWSEPYQEDGNRNILRHCARLKIDFGAPVFSWTQLNDFEGKLSLKNAEVSYKGKTGYTSTNINTWLAQGKNVWVVECENIPDSRFMQDDITATVSLERIGSRAFGGWYSGHFPKDADVGIGQTKTEILGNDIVIEESGAGVHFAVACRIIDNKNIPSKVSSHRGEMKNSNNKFSILVSVVTSNESQNPKEAAVALLNEAEQSTIAKLKKEKNDWYQEFWSKSFVKIGNDYLENIYYLRRYLMTAGSQGKYPTCFNGGLWRWNRDVLNWITPHHWNTQQSYWGLCAQNDPELMRPYLDTYFNMIPDAEALAKEKGAGDDAILITEAHDFDGRQLSKDWGNMKYNYTPASQIASLFWDYYDYTGDARFLKDTAYVFMRKAANFYLDKLEWDEGKNEYFLISTLYESESIKKAKNVISDRNCIEVLFTNCIEAATILKVDSEKIEKWKFVLNHLWERKIENEKDYGKVISPANEYYTEKRYSALNWISGGSIAFPSGIIGIDDKESPLGEAVANVVKCRTSTNAHYPTPVIAARMGMGDNALTYLLNGIKIHQMYPQGLMTNVTGYPDNIYNLKSIHDLLNGKYRIRSQSFFQCGMEPISNYATAVNEMMLQSNEGKIRVFPAMPKAWDNSPLAFKLLARGAFIVTSERDTLSEIIQVEIKSLQGNKCRLQNPWPKQKVSVYLLKEKNKRVKYEIEKGDVISFKTSSDAGYVVCPASSLPVSQVNTYSSKPNNAPKKLDNRILGKESGWDIKF
jgi:alpha-L-fucosidase 2